MSQDALCQNSLGKTASRSVKRDVLPHLTLAVPRKYNTIVVALCRLVAALIHNFNEEE